MTRVGVLICLYLAAGIAFLIAVNEDQRNVAVPFAVMAAIAIVLGWGTSDLGWRGLALWIPLPWIVVLLGLPFETTNRFTGGDCCSEVSGVAVFPAFASVVLMLAGAGARELYERHGHRTPPAE